MSLGGANHDSYLGVDIGLSGVKIVELKKLENKVVLATYGFNDQLKETVGNQSSLDVKETAATIKNVCHKAKTASNLSVASLPTYAVFSSIISVGEGLSKDDLAAAVRWEAKKVIPLSLDNVVLYWQKIENIATEPKTIKVLLVGAPSNLVRLYVETFKAGQLSLLSMETEVFSLIRSLLGKDLSVNMIVQIGCNSTNLFVVDRGAPLISRSLDVGGMAVTRAIGKSMNVDLAKAEQFKLDLASAADNNGLPKTITDAIAPIVNEIKYILNAFGSKEGRVVERIILTGGSAMLAGLADYVSTSLKLPVVVGDPWFRINYPVELKPVLDQIGPRMAVAIGLAMEEFDKS